MTTFEALSARRRNYIEAARDNGFEEGLRRLLSDLYPDNAHFIYELLQNAEDAGAREVAFYLQTDGLRVEHDGSRLFDLADIDSITGIGNSTKADDATTIGKFGVGFKAVFAYTQSPVIHSGEHSFAIHDLFVPVPLVSAGRNGWTTFWFPFDRADKPADQATREVDTALREISRTTLLFLNNIATISCVLADGDARLLERRELDEHVVEIESMHEEGGPAYWYRIVGSVTLEEESYPVAAAFGLQPHAWKQPTGAQNFSIIPVDGQVFIYFPAVKEHSGLQFHIHAPFASTVARDSVRDDPGNDAIVAGIAKLIAGTLPQMGRAGLITDGLLTALPNNNDELSERYTILRDEIKSAFRTKALTPKFGGGHAPSRELFRTDRIIRSTLTVEDANFLRGLCSDTDDELATGWLADREGRAGAFLASLDAPGFARDDVTEVFERVASIYDDASILEAEDMDEIDVADLKSWHVWISAKDDSWMRDFYAMLETLARARPSSYYANSDVDEFVSTLTAAPLLRVQNGNGVLHIPGPETYLPTAPGLTGERFVVDSLAVFEGEESNSDVESLRGFYRLSGVKLWDAAAQLNARLDAYTKKSAEITPEHLCDLETLGKLLEDGAVSPSTYSNRRIFVAVRADGTRYWETPRRVFLDEPFGRTGLASLFTSGEYLSTWDGRYVPVGRLDPMYGPHNPDIPILAVTLNAVNGLKIVKVGVAGNPEFRQMWVERETAYKKDSDWAIHNFDAIVAAGDETLLRQLWRIVASGSAEHADALYKSNGSSRAHVLQSQLLQKLISRPWILDLDGNLRLPEDITADELAKDLYLPPNAPLLEKAGFGRKAAADAERHKEDAELAKRYFGSFDELQRIAGLCKRDPDRFKALLEDMEMELRLPEAPTAAPERRARRAGELAENASARKYSQRMRSVYIQEPGFLSAARGYLTQLYTNDDGVMVCQICRGSMPFQIRGSYYFEAVQFIKGAAFDFRENRLALCPTCAAKYRHALETELEDLRDDLLTQSIGPLPSISVEVRLAGQAAQVRFVGKHAIDLQGVFSATAGEPIEDGEFDAPSTEENA